MKKRAKRIFVLTLALLVMLSMVMGPSVFASSVKDYLLLVQLQGVYDNGTADFTISYDADIPDGLTSVLEVYYELDGQRVETLRTEMISRNGNIEYADELLINTRGWESGEYDLTLVIDGEAMDSGTFYIEALPEIEPEPEPEPEPAPEPEPEPEPEPVVELAANERAVELEPGVPATVDFRNVGVELELMLPDGGVGSVQLDRMEDTEEEIPENLNSLGAFLKIERSEELAGVQATIKLDLPEVDEDVDMETLALYRFNEGTGQWDQLPSRLVNGQVWAEVEDFSLFGLFSAPVAVADAAPAPAPAPEPAPVPEPTPEPAPEPTPVVQEEAAPAPVALPQTDGGSAVNMGMMLAMSLMGAGGLLVTSKKKK
ncbi:LPXTG-motif cell wall anchor domain-containing protein [Tindallia magadiensis]|uniref:LPXTG-motif cell wall anchor domain-containing protein n=1 Tax=Tindallia magadiensis TaxID=69895 RepID=A0A1I3ERB5_9FIRM|nr:LPXTG cell wall anchor domain-containing protein [Tindallia magadiensis]SFI01515.1 LPXTG-motif cell wall anchor domain-containing protein [Tindallia magadiensis]